jgi:hypothetical protein
MRSPGRTAAAVALLVAGLVVAPAARADESSVITLTVRHGLLSLEARDVPLQTIVEAITERTGVRVRFDESSASALDELVEISLQDVSMENALRLLLRGRDLVFVYGPGHLAEARVYGRAARAPVAAPPAASVGATPAAPPSAALAPGAAPPATPPVAATPLDAATLTRLRSEALDSPDPDARARALESIAATGDGARIRDVAVAMLDRETNAGLLQRALDLVAEDRTVPLDPVVKLALSNPAPEVRVKALTHLGADAGHAPRARQTLEASAVNDPAPNVRDAARTLLQQVAPR